MNANKKLLIAFNLCVHLWTNKAFSFLILRLSRDSRTNHF